MKFNHKKLAAAAAAIICTASMCGCVDTGTIMTVENTEIKNGVYLYCQMNAYSSATGKINEERENLGESVEDVEDIFAEKIDGITASEWIKNDTVEQLKRLAAIEKLCAEKGVEVPEDELASINDQIKSMWENEDFYAQYFYGTKTIGEYYENAGIGKESCKQMYINSSMDTLLFCHYFDKDGETPVSDAEFDEFIKDYYANVKLIELEFDDKAGIALREEADIQAVRDRAQSYADRLNSGESFTQIKYEFDLINAQNEAYTKAEESYEDDTDENKPDFDTYLQNAVDAATADKAETVEELETVISKDSSSFDEDVTEHIWNSADNGKATLFETEDSIYVVVRDDITTKADWKESNRVTALKKIKGDAYEELLKAEYADYTVEANDYLVNNKYAPEKTLKKDK